MTGDRGTAVLDGRRFSIELQTAAGIEVIDFPGDRLSRCFDLQADRFADLLAGGPADPDLAAGRAALEWSAALDTSARRIRSEERS